MPARAKKKTSRSSKQPSKAVIAAKRRQSYVAKREADKMFDLWCRIKDTGKGGGYKGVGKKFNRDIKTVRRVSETYSWTERWEKIQEGIQKQADRSIVKREIDNLKYVKAVKNRALDAYLSLKTNPKPRASVRDVATIIELEEKIRGNLPAEPDSPVTDEEIMKAERALAMLEKMGATAMQALGDALVDLMVEKNGKDQ